MSTDQLLHHELPKLRVSADKMDKAPSSSDDKISSTITEPNQTENENDGVPDKNENENEITDDESYRTPTSKESKIPEILTCPAAPKKPKAFVSCKRKLIDQFQFFEDTNKEDMDAFFRSTYPKRTCPCT